MVFTNLPAELQIEIFGYLSNQNLKSVRAASTCCRDNASVWLFRSIVACARYQAMGAFQSISLHPTYRKYVKEIVFDATEYSRALAENEFAYHHVADRQEGLQELVSWHRHSRFKKYQLLYQEQEELKDGGILIQTVAKALEWMPHVDTIVYCSRPRQIPIEAKDMREILPRGIYPGSSHDSAMLSPANIASRVSENGFHHIIGAFSLAQYTKVREFRVETQPRGNGFERPTCSFGFKDFIFAQHSYLEAGKHFFRNLTNIDLTLRAQFTSSSQESFSNIRVLLSEAKNLRHLRVCISSLMHTNQMSEFGLNFRDGQSTFARFGLTTKWEHLQSIVLRGICTTEQELSNLIHRGNHTLRSIVFSYCVLTTGKWSNLVDETVYGTSICEFVLDHVNEERVGDELFMHLPIAESEQWSYEGKVACDANGERYFDEGDGKSVYKWRNLASELY